MDLLLLAGAVLAGFVLFFGKQAYDKAQRARQLQALSSIACPNCGSEALTVRTDTAYSCQHCGYDTDVAEEGQRRVLGSALRELAILCAVLEGAIADIHDSREVHSGDSTEGPFPERYRHGAREARGLAEKLQHNALLLERLGPAVAPLHQLKPPTRTRIGYNARVDETLSLIRPVMQALQAERQRLVQAYRSA